MCSLRLNKKTTTWGANRECYFYGNKLYHKARLRVDLFGDMKISEIEELKDFNIFYVSQGHEDLVTIKGELVKRKVRYIQIFNKTIERG